MDTLVPEIAKALIVFVVDPEVIGKLAKVAGREPYMQMVEMQLDEISACPDVSSYIFFSPPEAEEDISAWLVEYEDRCAFAANVEPTRELNIIAAVRRILNRNTTKKVVVLCEPLPKFDRDFISRAFAALDTTDLVLDGQPGGIYRCLGVSKWHSWLFEAGVLDSVENILKAAQAANATTTQLS